MKGAAVRIVSWNVNGLRACIKKGFMKWSHDTQPEIVGLQEVRAMRDQLPDTLSADTSRFALNTAEKRGYSGVAIWSQREPDEVFDELAPEFDREGRMLVARYGRLAVCSAYFPKGDGPNRDLSRVPYKLAFYAQLLERLQALRRQGLRVLCMGDFNTAHQAIDLARPKQNKKNSGFRPEEREALDAWFQAGWIDTFRAFEKGAEHYSWWSQRSGARQRNVGWRIDYVLASKAAMPFVTAAFIERNQLGSDHCPVGIEIDPAVMT